MIQITPQMKILVAVEAVDFRKGIDGLVGVCRIGVNLSGLNQRHFPNLIGTPYSSISSVDLRDRW